MNQIAGVASTICLTTDNLDITWAQNAAINSPDIFTIGFAKKLEQKELKGLVNELQKRKLPR